MIENFFPTIVHYIQAIGDAVYGSLAAFGNFIWGIPMIIMLLGTHFLMTVRTKFMQRRIGTAIRLSFMSNKKGGGDISNFGALMVALAATLGTGNIIGVGTAIAMGGPGAVFWCWLTGVFGIATKYSESLLAVKYRTKTEDGRMIGGAMVILDKVLHQHWLSVLFCIFMILAAFGTGNMSQANSVSALMEENFAIPTYVTGLIMAILVGVIMFGGIKWLARVCEFFVPIMAVFYVICCIILLFINYQFLWDALCLIVSSAFTPQAMIGGFAGGGLLIAMRFGLARGLFSNESGLGTAPIVAAAAKTENAVKQAMVSASATFWDTVVVCALTGLVLVSSVLAYPDIDFTDGARLTSMAFGKIHAWGGSMLTLALLTFVFSTLLGWSYYAERCLEYLGGKKGIVYFRIFWIIAIFVGSVAQLDLVWVLADCANALMAIPNLVAVIALSGVVAKETDKYLWGNKLHDYDPTMEH